MKQSNNARVLLLFAALLLFIPPNAGNGQAKPDTLANKVRQAIATAKIELIKKNNLMGDLKAIHDSYSEVDSLIALIPKPAPAKQKLVVRTQIERETVKVPVEVPVYRDENIWIVEGQYVHRPIIQTTACRTYGGDTFRVRPTYYEWKSTRGLFQKKDRNTYNKIFEK
ncbi:hypothetical protein GCM10027051_31170 [Niabella terrae]